MSVHGIYVKNIPKGMWRLVVIAASPEAALQQAEIALKNAIEKGHKNAEVACKAFDSSFYIPEMLSDISNKTPLFN